MKTPVLSTSMPRARQRSMFFLSALALLTSSVGAGCAGEDDPSFAEDIGADVDDELAAPPDLGEAMSDSIAQAPSRCRCGRPSLRVTSSRSSPRPAWPRPR